MVYWDLMGIYWDELEYNRVYNGIESRNSPTKNLWQTGARKLTNNMMIWLVIGLLELPLSPCGPCGHLKWKHDGSDEWRWVDTGYQWRTCCQDIKGLGRGTNQLFHEWLQDVTSRHSTANCFSHSFAIGICC